MLGSFDWYVRRQITCEIAICRQRHSESVHFRGDCGRCFVLENFSDPRIRFNPGQISPGGFLRRRWTECYSCGDSMRGPPKIRKGTLSANVAITPP